MGLKAEREGSLKSIFSSCVSIAIRCLYFSVIISVGCAKQIILFEASSEHCKRLLSINIRLLQLLSRQLPSHCF